jgi:MFS family permease
MLFVAPFADRGHPKRLVLSGLILSACGSLLFALGGSLPFFIIGRAMTGASMGCAGPALRALAANLDKSRSGERLGRMRGFEMAGYTSGPLFGVLLIEPFGLTWTFIVFASIAAIAFFVVSGQHLPTLPISGESHRMSFSLLKHNSIRATALMSATLFLPVGLYDALWDRYLTDRGASNLMVGFSFLVFTIPFIVLGARGGRLSDRYGSRRIALIGIAANFPIVVSYGWLTSAWLIIAFSMFEGAASAVTSPAIQSTMAKVAPPGRATAAQGLMGAGDLVAATIVSFIAPALYDLDSVKWLFTAIVAVSIVMLMLATWMSRDIQEQQSA